MPARKARVPRRGARAPKKAVEKAVKVRETEPVQARRRKGHRR